MMSHGAVQYYSADFYEIKGILTMRLTHLLILLLLGLPLCAAQLQLALPLGRMSYQTNEQIDLAVVRSDAQALPAGVLTLTLAGADASQLRFTFPLGTVELQGEQARATEHFKINGWLLRPGIYAVEVAAHGTTASTNIELFSHIRKSSFRLIDWSSRAQGADLTKLGEDGMGFNLIYGHYRQNVNTAHAETTLRGGMDFMQVCTMSGAHQMDLRMECDWSDPLVIRGGSARAVQQAFLDRTKPNALGVHFYDEPGLTWWQHATTNKMTPHNIPTQDAAFKGAFGKEALQYNDVTPENPEKIAEWQAWSRWKMSFMESAWKDTRAAVEKVNPKLLSATQSVYAFTAYADGYYFNVVRSLPIISGHGGYDDGPASYFYPSYHHEFGRVRELSKPNWYLPAWYGGMTSETFRLEQYLSFQTGLQGMAKPPDHQVHNPESTPSSDGIVESNKLMARLGTIFNTMPVTRGEVALLYSLSQSIDAQIKSGMEDNYEGGGHTRGYLLSAYLAGKMIHIPFDPVVEEDVLDGTLDAHHKAIVLAGINYLDAKVIAALESYAARGGAVLLTDDCQVQITGGVKVGAKADIEQYNLIGKLWATDQKESMRQRAAEYFMRVNEPLAKALQAKLQAVGVVPPVLCDNNRIVITRQAYGDLEYFFAVNAKGDPAVSNLALVPSTATLTLPGGAIYDAVRGGSVREIIVEKKGDGKTQRGAFRFGPGQMRVFARAARPIGGVQVASPVLARDLTQVENPLTVTVKATLVDTTNRVLVGSAPMQITLTDPLGVVRYDVYRATELGEVKLTLPLAANDAAGTWTVRVTELLNNSSSTATFAYHPAANCPVIAGAQPRAIFFGNERENIYRFFRAYQHLTFVVGTSGYNRPAAERLLETLKPWGVTGTIVDAAEVNKARILTPEEIKTWVGIEFGRSDADPEKNSPYKVGFAVNGPVILLGNLQDNPLIAKVHEWGFLPYTPTADFPGRGRGYLAWQLSAIGINQESVALIANDEVGMNEAVGTLYEAVAGLDPITPRTPPTSGLVTAATVKPTYATTATVAWQVTLPDRVVSLTAEANGNLTAVSWDGSQTVISAAGVAGTAKAISAEELQQAQQAAQNTAVAEALTPKLTPARVVKRVAANGQRTAIGYWGGTLQLFTGEKLDLQIVLQQDITALAWSKNNMIVALADGRVQALATK